MKRGQPQNRQDLALQEASTGNSAMHGTGAKHHTNRNHESGSRIRGTYFKPLQKNEQQGRGIVKLCLGFKACQRGWQRINLDHLDIFNARQNLTRRALEFFTTRGTECFLQFLVKAFLGLFHKQQDLKNSKKFCRPPPPPPLKKSIREPDTIYTTTMSLTICPMDCSGNFHRRHPTPVVHEDLGLNLPAFCRQKNNFDLPFLSI